MTKPSCPDSPSVRTAWQARWEREFKKRWVAAPHGAGLVPAPDSGYVDPRDVKIRVSRPRPARPARPVQPVHPLSVIDAAIARAKGGG